jgi:hypothetical protein
MTKKRTATTPPRRKLTPEEIDAMYPEIAVPEDWPEVGDYEGQIVNLRAFLRENRTDRLVLTGLGVLLDLGDGRGRVTRYPWRGSEYVIDEYGNISI